MWIEIALAGIWGYLLGSIPTGVLLGKLFRGVDVSQVGSGHTGGLNVTRNAGLLAGALTTIGDIFLGAVAVVLMMGNPWAAATAGMMAVLGHNWSLFLRFGGGIGLSTLAGVLFAFDGPSTLILLVILVPVWLGLIRLLRVHRARSTVVAICLMVPLLWAFNYPPPAILMGVMGGLFVIAKTLPDWNRKYVLAEEKEQAT